VIYRPVRKAEVIEVIRTEAEFGEGVVGDPCRIVTQFWSVDGELLATVDPFEDKQTRHLFEEGMDK
jgi:hypothetical protein